MATTSSPQPRSLLRLITDFVLGTRYYANVTFVRGNHTDVGLSYYIFATKAQAKAHAESLQSNKSYGFVQTISFRSRLKY